jgi:hypothetical protein
MFGHRRRQAASSLAVIRVRMRIAGAFSGTGSRSSDAIHGATAWINKRTRSSLSKIGSEAETDGRRLEESRWSRLDIRLPASLNKPRGAPNLDVFREGAEDVTRFEVIGYPGWRRLVADGFSAEVLIADLVAQIVTRVPRGPIRIVGFSIGGHFGYAAALRLRAMGREIAGFCAIDTFMMVSPELSEGWKSRALAEGLELLRGRRFREFTRFVRSRFWTTCTR